MTPDAPYVVYVNEPTLRVWGPSKAAVIERLRVALGHDEFQVRSRVEDDVAREEAREARQRRGIPSWYQAEYYGRLRQQVERLDSGDLEKLQQGGLTTAEVRDALHALLGTQQVQGRRKGAELEFTKGALEC